MRSLIFVCLILCSCKTLPTYTKETRPYQTQDLKGRPKTIQREFTNGRETGEYRPYKSYNLRGEEITIWRFFPR